MVPRESPGRYASGCPVSAVEAFSRGLTRLLVRVEGAAGEARGSAGARMKMLVFTTDRFRPYLPDRCQVNPNVLGFELAEWLSRALARAGVVTSYPNYEDWGWYLEFSDQSGEYLIGCSGSLDAGVHEWRVFVDRPRKLFRRPPVTSREHELIASVQAALSTEGISSTIEDV